MLFVLPRENPGSSERYYSSAKKEISIELERLLLAQVRERVWGGCVCVFLRIEDEITCDCVSFVEPLSMISFFFFGG